MESILQFFYSNKEAIFIIALTIFLGLEVISNVPSVLHTPTDVRVQMPSAG
jgi:NAD(P) transhydrogenase subunit alpha